MAIIGISSIHLLKTFIAIGGLGADPAIAAAAAVAAGSDPAKPMVYTQAGVMWQTIIHCVFILSAIGIAYTDKLMAQVGKPHKADH
jgi:uncharacterized protein (TIGR00645 family)